MNDKGLILLVEDEKAQREGLAQGLGHLGYRVTARADGRSGLTAFKKDPAAFDLVFHLAGCTRALSSASYYNVNQEGTASLCRALAAARALLYKIKEYGVEDA